MKAFRVVCDYLIKGKNMRLDKLIADTGKASRKEVKLAAKKGGITVNGISVMRTDMHVDPQKDVVSFFGEQIVYKKYTYVIMNKPAGYVSVTEAKGEIPALALLPEDLQKIGLFPAGRLDKSTTGLLFLTNDGETAHRLTSPKHHAEKEYAYTVKYPLSAEDISVLEKGVTLDDGYVTLPCRIVGTGEREGRIILREGKYHQIKRMMQAVHNSITSLCRVRYADLTLEGLAEGEWRELTAEETERILKN